MLEIRDLHVSIGESEILNGVNLSIKRGEVHAIMGPNGSGKSTLANVIAGKPGYDVTHGDIIYEGESILNYPPDQRALRGIFLAFQYPVELPGVRNRQFLKAATDALNKYNNRKELNTREFDKIYKETINQVGIDSELMKRSVNDGFSGGEKKRSEMLQLAILNPKFSILDEPDSGLDIDALRLMAKNFNKFRSSENSTLLVTHYQRILDYIIPNLIHVFMDGHIVLDGGPELASELEAKGYKWLKERADQNISVSE